MSETVVGYLTTLQLRMLWSVSDGPHAHARMHSRTSSEVKVT